MKTNLNTWDEYKDKEKWKQDFEAELQEICDTCGHKPTEKLAVCLLCPKITVKVILKE